MYFMNRMIYAPVQFVHFDFNLFKFILCDAIEYVCAEKGV